MKEQVREVKKMNVDLYIKDQIDERKDFQPISHILMDQIREIFKRDSIEEYNPRKAFVLQSNNREAMIELAVLIGALYQKNPYLYRRGESFHSWMPLEQHFAIILDFFQTSELSQKSYLGGFKQKEAHTSQFMIEYVEADEMEEEKLDVELVEWFKDNINSMIKDVKVVEKIKKETSITTFRVFIEADASKAKELEVKLREAETDVRLVSFD